MKRKETWATAVINAMTFEANVIMDHKTEAERDNLRHAIAVLRACEKAELLGGKDDGMGSVSEIAVANAILRARTAFEKAKKRRGK